MSSSMNYIDPRCDAMAFGYTPHDKFRIGDLSTYPEMIDAALQYQRTSGTKCDYPCWIPEMGSVRINPTLMLEYYNKAITQ